MGWAEVDVYCYVNLVFMYISLNLGLLFCFIFKYCKELIVMPVGYAALYKNKLN